MGFVEDILMWFVCLLIVIPMRIVADILMKLVVDIFMGFMGFMVDILVFLVALILVTLVLKASLDK